jgi:peptide-methionine (R)-S-oxide reductase
MKFYELIARFARAFAPIVRPLFAFARAFASRERELARYPSLTHALDAMSARSFASTARPHVAVRSKAPSRTFAVRRLAAIPCTASASSSSEDDARHVTKRGRRPLIVLPLAGAALAASAPSGDAKANGEFVTDAQLAVLERRGPIAFTEDEWKNKLEPFSYKVLRKEATERPFSSELNSEKRTGRFVCAGCGTPLFDSKAKYDSGTGWPSFYEPLAGAVMEVPDYSIMFLPRSEVRCTACQGHLGHVFEDGPPPTGLRYCMNGAAMKFEPASA